MQEVEASSGIPADVPWMSASGRGRWLDAIEVLLILAYPFVVSAALARSEPAIAAGLLAGLGGLRVAGWYARPAAERSWVAPTQALGLGLLAASLFAWRDGRLALLFPVFVNVALLLTFAGSLRGASVVERIATQMEGALSAEKRRYCRAVTKVWCGFFLANALVTTGLALLAPPAVWAAYTGVVAYVLIAAVFLLELRTRRRRFGDGTEGRRDWTRVAEKGSEWGLRFIWWVCRTLGRGPVRFVIRGVALYYVLSDSEIRRVSREFQQRVGRKGTFGEVYRHVLRFSFCIVDRMFLLSGRTKPFSFETHGDECIHAALAQGRGAILVSAHVGSFEALRAAAVDHDYPLSIVGNFQNAERINALLQALAPELAARVIQIDPHGVSHMMQIRQRLREGGLVGFLGDRMAPGAEGVSVEFLGSEVVFPIGPFSVAAAVGCPVLISFCMSRGSNEYVIHCEALEAPLERTRKARTEWTRDAVTEFARRLEVQVLASPDNWFNFYDFFTVPPPPAAGSEDA